MKNKQIKKPVMNKIAKVPVVMQMEASECGAASLTMILAYYDKWVPLEQVRLDCGVSRDGASAKNILDAAKNYGLEVQAYSVEPESLREEGEFPCIIHWNFNHFVVLNGFKGNKAYINDPARGNCAVSMEEFDTAFTGVCLMFEPGEAFEPGGKPKSMVKFAKKRMKGAGSAVLFVIVTTIIASLLGLVNPVLSKTFMDKLLPGNNPEWLKPFILVLIGVGIIQVAVLWVKAVLSLKINGKMAGDGSRDFMWKLMHLPMSFFSQRLAGDIAQRKDTNASIAKNLVETLAPLVIDTIMMLVYLFIMIRYSLLLTLVGVSAILINIFVSRLISKKRVNITRVMMRDSGKLNGTTVSGIEMIETIKSSGCENGFFEKWAGYQASVNNQQVRFAKLNQYLGMIPQIVSSLSGIAILILGVYITMRGNFTVGMIMAFQGFMSSFMAPVTNLIGAGQTLQEMRTEMERVDDVMEYPSDAIYETDGLEGNVDYKLSGRLELKNVTFGYSRLAEPLIKDFSLDVKPGSKIAFVGSSGCGKSTLSKLISGLYKPWSGEILFDGKPLNQIDRKVFINSVGLVDQDIVMFEDTISDNIKMWNDSIPDSKVIEASHDAQIYDDIIKREGGYDYSLTEGGKDFSGGQKQRMEIARVLAQDPTILIMDEATSALDAKTEFEVVKSIKNRGITTIVVAHRLSTIRDCDEIIVLHQGKVIERGTHEQLYANGGYYAQLVSNE